VRLSTALLKAGNGSNENDNVKKIMYTNNQINSTLYWSKNFGEPYEEQNIL
jgi:hypothetical protein